MKTTVDRVRGSGVGRRVRSLGVALLAFALLGGAAACKKDKGGSTTPSGGGAKGGEQTGVNDKEPEGDPGPGGGTGGDGSGTGTGTGTGTGGEAGTDTGTGGDGGQGGDGGAVATPEEPAPPPIIPPNLDISPELARVQVTEHLGKARAMLSAKTPDPDGAIREAQAALAVDGTSIDAIVVIAHANYHKKLYDTAEVILDGLLANRKTSKTNSYLYFVYGLVYDKINEPQKAFAAYRKAVELEPRYASALINLGIHQLTNKQYGDAVSTFEKVRSLGQQDAGVLNALGSAYRGISADFDPNSPSRAEWLSKAETAYKQALTVDRTYGPAYYNLGLLYLDASPFPTPQGPMDELVRLGRAKTYFDEYRSMPGVDIKLYEERTKDVTKLIKREEKKRAKSSK